MKKFLVLKSLKEAVKIFIKVKFKGKFMIPFAVTFIIFIAYYFFGGLISDCIFNLYDKKFQNTGIYLDGFIKILLRILIIIIEILIFKFLYLTLISPYLGLYSEKIEEFYRGNSYKSSIMDEIIFFIRGIIINFIFLILELLLTLGIFLLSFFVLGQLLGGIFSIFIEAFFIGYSLLDSCLERRKLDVKSSLKWAKKDYKSIMLIGLVFMLIMVVPFLGIFIGPVYCTGLATIYILRKEKLEEDIEF